MLIVIGGVRRLLMHVIMGRPAIEGDCVARACFGNESGLRRPFGALALGEALQGFRFASPLATLLRSFGAWVDRPALDTLQELKHAPLLDSESGNRIPIGVAASMQHETDRQIDRDGFRLLRGAVAAGEIAQLGADLDEALARVAEGGSVRSSQGTIYAARNLLDLWPGAIEAARHPGVAGAVGEILGKGFGLVRAIFFDKPPGAGWSLAWHKDTAIAVRDNSIRRPGFGAATVKAGVPHVEAPEEVLERMLIARIHLDDATEENGALRVIPGSHREGKAGVPAGLARRPNERTIAARAGDALLMRPMLTHASDRPCAGASRRRVLHFEFAARGGLPGGLDWHQFVRIERRDTAEADPEAQI